MTPQAESAARAAIRLAVRYQRAGKAIDGSVAEDILAETRRSVERADAIKRRNQSLQRAYAMIGDVVSFENSLNSFYLHKWPIWRLSAPESVTELQRELYAACQAIADGNLSVPQERQLRRIVCPSPKETNSK